MVMVFCRGGGLDGGGGGGRIRLLGWRLCL